MKILVSFNKGESITVPSKGGYLWTRRTQFINKKCREELYRVVPSTILLFHLVSLFQELHVVFWS